MSTCDKTTPAIPRCVVHYTFLSLTLKHCPVPPSTHQEISHCGTVTQRKNMIHTRARDARLVRSALHEARLLPAPLRVNDVSFVVRLSPRPGMPPALHHDFLTSMPLWQAPDGRECTCVEPTPRR